jgi:hypothetical protein
MCSKQCCYMEEMFSVNVAREVELPKISNLCFCSVSSSHNLTQYILKDSDGGA